MTRAATSESDQGKSNPLRDHFLSYAKEIHKELDEQRAEDKLIRVSGFDRSERIHFGHLALEIAESPSEIPFLPLSESQYIAPYDSRLNLHLSSYGGLQATRVQLGRIARYVQARNLQEEYPLIVATTYRKLARATKAIIPRMVYARGTYFSDVSVKRSIDRDRAVFEQRNNCVLDPDAIETLLTTTELFIEDWVDYENTLA